MKQRLQILGKRAGSILFLCLLLILCDKNSALAQNRETDCEQVKGQWEQLYQEMKDKLDGFTSLEQTPIERIIKKPIVNPGSSETIAAQISHALQVKEDLLISKRKELRNLINVETKLFSELQHCLQAEKSSRHKDAPNILKKRKALLDKAVITMAEVKEIEGRETVMPYSEAAGQDQYRRSVYNQWQNQGQYRGWWGY
ncbi:MAG: hypothetical protein WC647_05935 [Desulfomonilaceae bacterium]